MEDVTVEGRTLIEGPGPGERPPPRWTSIAGAVGAALLVGSLGSMLAELGDRRRLGGIAIGLLFQVLGVALLVVNRGRRSATAGVGLTAIGLVPLLIFLFVDVDNPSTTIDSVGDFTRTATLILLAAAAIWFVAYRFGPSRGYAIYLAGALLALWLVAVVQIVNQPLVQIGRAWSTSYSPYGSVDSSGSWTNTSPDSDFEADLFTEAEDDLEICLDDPPTDEDACYEAYDQAFDSIYGDMDPYPDVDIDNPSRKLGIASLVFGVGYLALAALGDCRGKRRQGTAVLFAAIPILYVAVGFLSPDLKQGGTALLTIALGAAAIWLGTVVNAPHGRRATSWIGGAAVAAGLFALVDLAAGDNGMAAAVLLGILGLAVTFAAYFFDPDKPAGGGAPGPEEPTSGDSAWDPGGGPSRDHAPPTGAAEPWAPISDTAPDVAPPPDSPTTIDGAPWAPPPGEASPPSGSSF